MKYFLSRWLLIVIAALFYTAPITASHAETLEWQFRSEHPKVVDVELYSHSRRGHVWPGNNKVYVLNDYSTKTIRISCRSGEKVCYGAWVRNRSNLYWGVGYKNRNRCSSCCYTCNGGQTKVIVLNP